MKATLHQIGVRYEQTKVTDHPLLLILERAGFVTVRPKDGLTGQELLRATSLRSGIVKALDARNVTFASAQTFIQVQGIGEAVTTVLQFPSEDFARSGLGN